jgi:two-component system, NarL family, response regulator DesR
MIRIVLGYSRNLLRQALVDLLASEPDMAVVAAVERREQLLAVATESQPDVLVVDLSLAGLDTGPAADLPRNLTRVAATTRTLLIVDEEVSPGLGRTLVQLAPRVGLLTIDAMACDLLEGVRKVSRGELVLDPVLMVRALKAGATRLTPRETDVLRHARQGGTAKEIARDLHLSTGTVRNYLSRALNKTGARTRIEAVRIAQDQGWI